jgi:hypothetical protein
MEQEEAIGEEGRSSPVQKRQRTGDQLENCFGIPSEVFRDLHRKGNADVWNFFLSFKKPVTYQHKGKTYTHVCVLCAETVAKNPNAKKNDWKVSLCSVQNSTNANAHMISKHKRNDYTKKLLESKMNKSTANVEEQHEGSLISKEVQKQKPAPNVFGASIWPKKRFEAFKGLICRRAIFDLIPFNSMKTQDAITMQSFAIPSDVIEKHGLPSVSYFENVLNGEFTIFTKLVTNLLLQNQQDFGSLPFMVTLHDMWESGSKKSILGVSNVFITRDFKLVSVATIFSEQPRGHSAAIVQHAMKTEFHQRYQLDLDKLTSSIISDTTPSATNVGKNHFEGAQEDCDMHVESLILKYGFGLLENTKKEESIQADGTLLKKTLIVTPGGPFLTGTRLIANLRKYHGYFNHAQRSEQLRSLQEMHLLPVIKPIKDNDTRIGGTIELFKCSILLRGAFDLFFMNYPDAAFINKHGLSLTDWNTICQMEGVGSLCGNMIKGFIQKEEIVTSSYAVLFQRRFESTMDKNVFKCLTLETPDVDCTLESQKRVSINLNTFTDDAKQCVIRIRAQLEIRNPMNKEAQKMAMFIDPRVNQLAPKVLLDLEYDDILTKTKMLHRRHYTQIMSSKSIAVNLEHPMETPVEEEEEEEYFSFPSASNTVASNETEAVVADSIFDTFLSYTVNWHDEYLRQNPKAKETTPDIYHEKRKGDYDPFKLYEKVLGLSNAR